jgi:hypothetical protein
VQHFYNLIQLLTWYIEYNYKININVNANLINNLLTELTNEIANKDCIDTFIRESDIFYTNLSSTFIYSNFINTVNYPDFLNRFSSSVKAVVYYTTNTSIANIFTQVYNQYFNGVTFQYKVYAQNQYIYKTYSITLTQLEQYIYSYLIFKITNKDNDVTSNQNFENILNQITNLYFENISTTILINLYTWVTGNIISPNINRNALFDKLNDYIFDILNDNYWGIVYQENNINYKNNNLYIQVLLLNYDTMITNNPKLTTEYIYKINYKLENLYNLFILNQMIIVISDYNYQELFLAVLLNCNQYLYKGQLINCINLQNDISIRLDYMNQNYLTTNNISNYFKSISNDSIKSIVSYGVLNYIDKFLPASFLQGFYAYGEPNPNFLPGIYNILNITYNLNNETSILRTFFQNSISGILNQYSTAKTTDYNLTTSNKPFIDIVFNNMLTTVNKLTLILQTVYGGIYNGNASATLSIGQILNIFSTGNYKLSNSSVTIFTMIYQNLNNLNSDNINYLILILLFYYTAMTIYILNKKDPNTGENLFNNNYDLILLLVYIINDKILKYSNGENTVDEIVFFQKLTNLLFGIQNDYEYQLNSISFFDSIIDVQTYTNQIIANRIDYNIGTKMYSGTGILPGREQLIDNLYNKYIVNDKTRVWKTMLSIIVDPNKSDTIYQMKSMFKDNLINIPQIYMDRILYLSDGLLDPNGILKYLEKIELYIGEELIDTLSQEMYNIIKPTYIIVTGGDTRNLGKPEAYIMKEYLVKKGLPSDKIYCEIESINTIENGEFTYQMLTHIPKNTKIYVLTSEFHSDRAEMIFQYYYKDFLIQMISSITPISKIELDNLKNKEFYLIDKLKKYLKI